MANTFFDPGDQRAAKVHNLFSRIAPRYDLINDLQSFGLHRYWKRRVIQLACPQPRQRALDLCCGTGDLALALARHGAQVTGLDFSERMLEVAERRKGRNPKPQRQSDARNPRGKRQKTDIRILHHATRDTHHVSRSRFTHHAPPLTTPHYVRGDAQRIPFPENSFDIVTVGYGLRNLANWEAGLREMQRVAKAGGRVVVLDFGKPDNPLWRGLYFTYLRLFVPCLGRVFCGSAAAYAYILESLQRYPGPARCGGRNAQAEPG